jgi:hypothetical protein
VKFSPPHAVVDFGNLDRRLALCFDLALIRRNHWKVHWVALIPVVRQLACLPVLSAGLSDLTHARVSLSDHFQAIVILEHHMRMKLQHKDPRQADQVSWNVTPAWTFFDSTTVEEQQAPHRLRGWMVFRCVDEGRYVLRLYA